MPERQPAVGLPARLKLAASRHVYLRDGSCANMHSGGVHQAMRCLAPRLAVALPDRHV